MAISKSRDKKRRVRVQLKRRPQVLADLQDALLEAQTENRSLVLELNKLRKENEEIHKANAAMREALKEKPQPMVFEYKDPGLRYNMDDYPTELEREEALRALNQEQFSTGAVRRKTPDCRLDLIPLEALEAMGDRLHYGATVRGYGERNWEKGIPYANLIQHTITHTSRFAAQIINNPITHPAGSLERNQTWSENIREVDSPYGNACAALWNWMVIVTFLRRGNPAERKHV